MFSDNHLYSGLSSIDRDEARAEAAAERFHSDCDYNFKLFQEHDKFLNESLMEVLLGYEDATLFKLIGESLVEGVKAGHKPAIAALENLAEYITKIEGR